MKIANMENLNIKDRFIETIYVNHDHNIKQNCLLVKPSVYEIARLSFFIYFLNELIIFTTLYEFFIGYLNMLLRCATN